MSFNSFVLLFKLKDILNSNSVSCKYHGRSQTRCSRLGAAITGMRKEFWFFSSGKQDLISTKNQSFTFIKCHLFYTYFIKAQSRLTSSVITVLSRAMVMFPSSHFSIPHLHFQEEGSEQDMRFILPNAEKCPYP